MQAYWAKAPADLLRLLDTSASGLTQREAEARVRRLGENTVSAREGVSAAPAAAPVRKPAGADPGVRRDHFSHRAAMARRVIILLIVLGSTVLGFVQEYRASDAIRRLRETLALKVMALRDGRARDLDRP